MKPKHAESGTAASSKPASSDAPTSWRSKLKLAAFAAVPTLAALLLVELALQWLGIPYSPDALLRPHFVAAGDGRIATDSFLAYEVEGGAYYQTFSKQKPPKTFRIAILGGSSVFLLQDAARLQRRLVDAGVAEQVEVMNFGLCGCGTDRAVVSARQALQFDIDAMLVYSGHNDFISESNYKTYRQPGPLRRYSKLVQLCTGNPWLPEPGRFYSEAEKDEVYRQYEQNLRAIHAMTKEAGVPLIWGTVSPNLILPPMVYTSPEYDGLEVPQAPLEEHRRGLKLAEEEKFDEARRPLEQGIADSPRPWRATYRNNRILRDTAAELSIPLADVEQRVIDETPHGLPGLNMMQKYRHLEGLFNDHCHLNQRGNEILLDTFADVLIEQLHPPAKGDAPQEQK